MGKGLKQVKASKGRGTEETASEVWLGEDPRPAGPIAGKEAFHGPHPRSQARALEEGSLFIAPAPCLHRDPPTPGLTQDDCGCVIRVLCLPCLHVCVVGTMCLRPSASRTLDCPES